jgi:hypothetical protein
MHGMSNIRIVEKIVTHLFNKFFSPQLVLFLRDNMEKYDIARQATDDNVPWIIKATDMHSEYVMYFHSNSGYVNALQFYVYTYIACLITNQLNILQLLFYFNICWFSANSEVFICPLPWILWWEVLWYVLNWWIRHTIVTCSDWR